MAFREINISGIGSPMQHLVTEKSNTRMVRNMREYGKTINFTVTVSSIIRTSRSIRVNSSII